MLCVEQCGVESDVLDLHCDPCFVMWSFPRWWVFEQFLSLISSEHEQNARIVVDESLGERVLFLALWVDVSP